MARGAAARFYAPRVEWFWQTVVADMICSVTSSGRDARGLAGGGICGRHRQTAQLNNLYAVAADASGNLYVADTANHIIRKVNSGGVVTAGWLLRARLPGRWHCGAARFNAPQGCGRYGGKCLCDRQCRRCEKSSRRGQSTLRATSGRYGKCRTGTLPSLAPNGSVRRRQCHDSKASPREGW